MADKQSSARSSTLKKQKDLNKKLAQRPQSAQTTLAAVTTGSTAPASKDQLNPYYGKWLKPGKYDDYIQDFAAAKDTTVGGGIVADSEKLIATIKHGKANADFYNISSLATLISDKQNPFLEMHAKNVWPSLKSVPEETYRDNLVLQASIHRIMENGVLTSEEDLQLMYYLARPDADIPIFPIWDPSGSVFTETGVSTALGEYLVLAKNEVGKNLFNPYSIFGLQPQSNKAAVLNALLKAKIFKRVFPGLREQDEANVTKFIAKMAERKLGNDSTATLLSTGKGAKGVYFNS